MNRTITVTDIEPAPLSIRHPLGINLDLRLTMKDQRGVPVDPATALPQLVLLPRSRGGAYPYDMTAHDSVKGISRAQVPGTSLTDVSGYGIELYLRSAGTPPLPTQLAAKGTLVTEGSAYSGSGPMNMINIPVVTGPPGPAGMQGIPGPSGSPGADGQRGSMWFTGLGDPTIVGDFVIGDMYLDQSDGGVWRWEGAAAWVHQ